MSFERLCTQAVQDGTVPGVVLFAASSSGIKDYAKAFGYRSLQTNSKEPLQLDTLLTLASCTKLLTTICVLQLSERGIVTLDEDVSNHVPVLARQSVLTGFADDGSPILVQRQGHITLRHLLTHSSGAGYLFMDPRLQRYIQYTGKTTNANGTINELFDLPLLHQPGKGWTYGSGVAWAGKVVEKFTGQSLDVYMQENIFSPLGITRITFFPEKNAVLANQLSDMSVRDHDTGKLTPASPGLPVFPPLTDCLGGEGAYGDLQDFMKVLKSLLLDDERLLKRETARLMFEPQLPSQESRCGLHKAMEDPSWAVGDFSGPKEFDWAFGGLLVVGDAHPIRKRGHLSWSGAPNLYWFIDRDAGLCAVFGTQVLPPGDALVEALISGFEKEVYAFGKNY